jgi:hypothetical protein
MVRKTDSPAKRMRQLRHHGAKGKPFFTFAEMVLQFCPQQQISKFSALDPNSPEFERLGTNNVKISPDLFWDRIARRALSLGDDNDRADREMRRAFEYFKLDHRNPWSWRLLVTYFSHVEFAEKRKRDPGPKRKWTADKLIKLRTEIKERRLENLPATKIATQLARDKSSTFHGQGKEMLRQMIGILRTKI